MKINSDQNNSLSPKWLDWAREIQAISQTGIHFAENDYQIQRYSRLMEISAEILSSYSASRESELIEIFNQQVGYATPRIDVRGAVFRAGKLLLVREVYEESGFEVMARKIIGVYDANRTGPLEIFHAFKIVFLCDILAGEERTSEETSEVKFFSQDELPENLSGERSRPRHLDDAFDSIAHERPTIFD